MSAHNTHTATEPEPQPVDVQRSAVAALGRVLTVWAHPDDETYLAAGVLAIAADLGQRPVVVTATDGELGFGDDIAWPVARARRTRRWEAAAAMAVLHVADHRWLGFSDGGCASVDRQHAVQRLTDIIDDVVPDTVLTFGPDGVTGHPDHCAVAAWTSAAVRRARRPPRLLVAVASQAHADRFASMEADLGVVVDGDGPPVVDESACAVHLRLHGELLDRKVVALQSMATQTSSVIAAIGMDTYAAWVATEAFVDASPPPAGRIPGLWPGAIS